MLTDSASKDAAPSTTEASLPQTSATTARMLSVLREYSQSFLNSRLMDERRSLPPAVVSDFAEAGLLGLRIPRQYGGQELPHVETIRVYTQLGAIDANLAVFAAVHNTLGVPPIMLSATEEVKSYVLPRLARGQALTTSAISEPGIGSHVRGMTTTAIRNRDGSYIINGSKKWISLGGDARYVNVFAQLRDERGQPRGITGFLVNSHTPGFTVGPEMLTLGLRAVPQYDLTFSDLQLPPSALLGAEGEGLATAKAAFMSGRVALAAMTVGAAMRSIELAQRFARGRTVATGPLVENGRIREAFSEAAAEVQAVETLVSRIATWQDEGKDVPDAWYFCAKILGCELGWHAIDTALQVLAARGFLDTSAVGQHFRDYRLFRIFEGSTEAIAVYLGSALVRKPDEIARLVEQYQPEAEVLKMVDQVVEIAARRPDNVSASHVHAAVVGELVCWTLLAMVTGELARRSAMDAYTASWTENQLRQRLSNAQLRSSQELPTMVEFSDHVAGYAGLIGDVDQQRWPGEEWRADPLLR